MFRLKALSALAALLFFLTPFSAPAAESGLVTESGNLLRGTVYKSSGIAREGVITIKTKWNMPAIAPIYRFDFDIMNGLVEDNLYSFMMGDVAELIILPEEDGYQTLTIKLVNGLLHKIRLTTDKKALLGPVKIWIENVRILTDGYGENIIPADEITRIVFTRPAPADKDDMSSIINEFGKAIEVGVRDDLIDEHLAVVMEKIQKKMKARLRYEKSERN